jgi:hypothetical protein
MADPPVAAGGCQVTVICAVPVTCDTTFNGTPGAANAIVEVLVEVAGWVVVVTAIVEVVVLVEVEEIDVEVDDEVVTVWPCAAPTPINPTRSNAPSTDVRTGLMENGERGGKWRSIAMSLFLFHCDLMVSL